MNVFFPTYQIPSEKRTTLKGTNMLPHRTNSILLKYIPFRKRSNNNIDRIFSAEYVISLTRSCDSLIIRSNIAYAYTDQDFRSRV